MDRKGMDHRKLNDQEGRDMSDYGKVLRVNLSEGTVGEEDVKEKLLRDYIGGRGYASKVLYDELPANTDPLGPENKLIFCNGPLTGRGAPAAGRYMVVTKSPLTGYIASSNSGGHWGAELAKSGWFYVGHRRKGLRTDVPLDKGRQGGTEKGRSCLGYGYNGNYR
jgi:hypothetical protein